MILIDRLLARSSFQLHMMKYHTQIKSISIATQTIISNSKSPHRKTKKNMEKKKDKNREKWAKRETDSKNKVKEKQEERQDNIAKYRGKAASKKRVGFEGSRGGA
jgi:Skp family chaperone for outer membrane proteins